MRRGRSQDGGGAWALVLARCTLFAALGAAALLGIAAYTSIRYFGRSRPWHTRSKHGGSSAACSAFAQRKGCDPVVRQFNKRSRPTGDGGAACLFSLMSIQA